MLEVTATRLVCALSDMLRDFKVSANDAQQLVCKKHQGSTYLTQPNGFITIELVRTPWGKTLTVQVSRLKPPCFQCLAAKSISCRFARIVVQFAPID